MLVIALLVRGLGLGAVFIPLMAVGFVGLAREEVPHASIVTRIAQQIGGAAGTAVLAVILQGAVASAGPVEAFQHAFWWAVGFTAVAVALALLLPGRPKPARRRRPRSTWRRSPPSEERSSRTQRGQQDGIADPPADRLTSRV